MQITVDIPEPYVVHHNAQLMAQKLKLCTALFMYQYQQLSRGAACEFSGVDIYTFMAACKQHKIPVINDSLEEIEAELQGLKETINDNCGG